MKSRIEDQSHQTHHFICLNMLKNKKGNSKHEGPKNRAQKLGQDIDHLSKTKLALGNRITSGLLQDVRKKESQHIHVMMRERMTTSIVEWKNLAHLCNENHKIIT